MAYTQKNSDIIKGGHLMVMMEVSGTLTPIAFATSHSFNKSLQTQEVATKDHGDFSAILPQRITWEASTENLYSLNGYKQLNDLFKNMTPVKVYFGETSYKQTPVIQEGIVISEGAQGAQAQATNWTTAGFGEQGDAYITSLQVTAGAGDNATFSATFTGTGALTEVNAA